jgi:ankyrin repeat protein
MMAAPYRFKSRRTHAMFSEGTRLSSVTAAVVNQEKEHITNVKTIDALVTTHGHDLDALGENSRTALYIAVLVGRFDCASKLCSLGANVDICDDHGKTPAWVAADAGNLACLVCLKEAGADLQKADCFGYSPLHRAAFNGHTDCMHYLIKQGCDFDKLNNGGYSPLWNAAYHGHSQCVKRLLGAGCNNHLRCGLRKYTALQISESNSCHGSTELLRAKAKPW